MKVLVTGGAGFIGSSIVDCLINNNYQAIIVDNLSTGKKENINISSEFYLVDIRDYKSLENVFKEEKPDFVIHNAAQISVQNSLKNPILDAETNIIGTINLLRCCAKFNVKKIVYASSAAVYGNPEYLGVDENHKLRPLSFYGISKQTSENYIMTYSELYNMKYTILRYSNVYGIRQDPKGEGGVISIFMDKLLNKEQPVIFGDGLQTRDFIYVEDVALANLAALHSGEGETINISCNKPTSLIELIKLMSEIYGADITPTFVEAKSGDIWASYLDNNKARRILSWEPIFSLREGLKLTIEFYANVYVA